MHSIQSSLQILLQACGALSVGFLRSWVLSAPCPAALGNRHSWSLVGTYLAGLDSHVLAESGDFIQDHLAHLADVFDDFEVEVEGCGTSGLV